MPETRYKNESANQFLSRFAAYDGDFEDEAKLIAVITHIEARSNAEPNDSAGMPPVALFMREQESLGPVGNVRFLEEMVGDVQADRGRHHASSGRRGASGRCLANASGGGSG